MNVFEFAWSSTRCWALEDRFECSPGTHVPFRAVGVQSQRQQMARNRGGWPFFGPRSWGIMGDSHPNTHKKTSNQSKQRFHEIPWDSEIFFVIERLMTNLIDWFIDWLTFSLIGQLTDWRTKAMTAQMSRPAQEGLQKIKELWLASFKKAWRIWVDMLFTVDGSHGVSMGYPWLGGQEAPTEDTWLELLRRYQAAETLGPVLVPIHQDPIGSKFEPYPSESWKPLNLACNGQVAFRSRAFTSSFFIQM